MSDHTCHAHPCNTQCPPHHLMCRRHWLMVPPEIAREVNETYTPGQCTDRRKIRRDWLTAALAAVRLVNLKLREAER